MDDQQAADEARHLVERSERDWWRLAEITWHQINAGADRAQWAAEVGVTYVTANRWVQLWDRFGTVPADERPRYAKALRMVLRGEA